MIAKDSILNSPHGGHKASIYLPFQPPYDLRPLLHLGKFKKHGTSAGPACTKTHSQVFTTLTTGITKIKGQALEENQRTGLRKKIKGQALEKG
ncbi:hypothetical protein PQO01_13285 [Lentisphaera marina]|uniref:hypothetical protein n=1 Tax=Lentisphaera marina TaxID=1111041 RepID=UPI002366A9AE|nr:hypothetical protein [Lentisphaera marina]MDD7985917.1 hypothetical protein [Lentisphaera marina]